ncbi:MAG: ABC transporter permease [Bacteroidia bacterium]
MSIIGLIIKREYLTRVKKKSFIIMTILGPLLMGGFIAFYIYLAMNQGDTVSKIKVIDETSELFPKLKSSNTIIFEKDTMPIEIARKIFNSNDYYAILYIPSNTFENADSITMFTEKQPSLTVSDYVENNLQKQLEEYKLNKAGINKATLDSIKTKVNLVQKAVDDKGNKEFSAGLTAGIGFAAGLLIYLFIFIYGIQVMRGVIEEKTNRIVEVIISSVRPFQLMMGKIIGIAFVGLTQFLLWIVLTSAVTSAVSSVMVGKNEKAKEKMEQFKNPGNSVNKNFHSQSKNIDISKQFDLSKILESLNLTKILFAFLFYFLGGYLLYSALFAAVGSAVDSDTDVQQFMLPVTLPLIFGYIVSTIVMANPESSLGFWCSIIPFTSPIVMMVRMPFDPPWFDIILSMIMLILGFIGTTWIASRIYRTGILMYGKKPSWKELGKWLFYKG